MQLQHGTSLRKHELRRKRRIEQPLAPIAVESIASHCCESLGSVGKGNSPVLSLCRPLLAAGFNPDQALDVYRAGTSALRVKNLHAGLGRSLDHHVNVHGGSSCRIRPGLAQPRPRPRSSAVQNELSKSTRRGRELPRCPEREISAAAARSAADEADPVPGTGLRKVA